MFKVAKLPKSLIVLLLASAVALVASIVLSYEALLLAKNSEAILSCDINAVISCAAVSNHWSASILGIPNSFIGMIFVPVVITIAVSLLSGVKFPNWFMRATQLALIGGILFAGWMFYMSVYVIGILCPWCLTTDLAMIVMFFAFTDYAIRQGVLVKKNNKLQKKLLHLSKGGYVWLAMFSSIVIMALLIVLRFGSDLFV